MASRHRLGLWASILTAWATTQPVVELATYATEPQAKVQFSLLDIPSAKLVPAMVCIRDLQDNSVRLPIKPYANRINAITEFFHFPHPPGQG